MLTYTDRQVGTASVAYEQGEKNERLLNPYPLAEPAGWVKKHRLPAGVCEMNKGRDCDWLSMRTVVSDTREC